MRTFSFAKGLILAGLTVLAAPASAANLVVNPGFESGNTGFTSGYAYSPGNLLSAGTYDVGSSPKADNGFFTYNTPPHSGNLEMIVNGASTANVPVWGESGISVLANTTYYFSAWIASVTSTSPAQLDFSINGSQIGSTFTATSTGEYEEFFATWNSGAATTASLSLVNQNTAAGGNDFVLDDISLDTTAPGGGTSVGGTGTGQTSVPEPSGLLLIGGGLLASALLRRRSFASYATS